MLEKLTPRQIYLAMFAGCTGLIAFGLYLQHYRGLEPCPMCIMQRYAFVACGLIALAAGLHNPALTGRRIYSGLIVLAALAGGGVAARQSWIQHFPPPKEVSCGPDLEFMLDAFPLAQALPMIFKGSGDCAEVKWTFLGLSIPEWALVCFAGVIAGAVLAIWHRKTAPAAAASAPTHA